MADDALAQRPLARISFGSRPAGWMRILAVLSRYAYGKPERGDNYDYVHFVPALRALGHDVELFDSGERARYESFSALNAALVEHVVSFKPDLIFTVLMHYEIWMETLDLIRARRRRASSTGAPTIVEVRAGVAIFREACRSSCDHRSGVASIAPRRSASTTSMLSQWAASADALQEPLPSAVCRYDVSFVGSLYGDRKRWIEALRTAGIDGAMFRPWFRARCRAG